MSYSNGAYWNTRQELLYYKYLDYIIRCVAYQATSLLDVGTGNCPYLEWFDWIPERVSFDRNTPYSSNSINGIEGSFLDYTFEKEYDVVTCLQVLEHIPEPKLFARKLLELTNMLVVSVPYKWPKNSTVGHVNDPVDEILLKEWFSCEPDYSVIISEPFKYVKEKRLISIYSRGSSKKLIKYKNPRIFRAMGQAYLQVDN